MGEGTVVGVAVGVGAATFGLVHPEIIMTNTIMPSIGMYFKALELTVRHHSCRHISHGFYTIWGFCILFSFNFLSSIRHFFRSLLQLVFLVPGGPVAPEAEELIAIVVKTAAVGLTAFVAFDHMASL
jgi:hypothetical protein